MARLEHAADCAATRRALHVNAHPGDGRAAVVLLEAGVVLIRGEVCGGVWDAGGEPAGNGLAGRRRRVARATGRPAPEWRPGRNPMAGMMRSSLPTSLRRRLMTSGRRPGDARLREECLHVLGAVRDHTAGLRGRHPQPDPTGAGLSRVAGGLPPVLAGTSRGSSLAALLALPISRIARVASRKRPLEPARRRCALRHRGHIGTYPPRLRDFR
jgi:hypothetical protein